MELTAQALDLTLATPFRISRSTQLVANNVLARIEHDGLVGSGEAAPSPFYGERRESVLMALDLLAEQLGDDPSLIEDVVEAGDAALGENAAAKAAIDMALYDLLGQRLGVPVYALLGLNPTRTPCTSFTIGMDAPRRMAERAEAAAREYPILKIKLGGEADLEIVRAIRGVTDVTLRVDANAAWTPKQALHMIEALVPYRIEFVEQPVAKGDLEGLRLVYERSPLPIIADESCVRLEDVAKIAGRADGINIKLMKCGGIAHALKMIHAARAHHLRVMLGCMIESSLAITAAAHLSPLVDYADLDGMLLVKDDPFDGVRVERGKLILPEGAGLGVRPRDGARDGARNGARNGARRRGGQRERVPVARAAQPEETPPQG